MPQIKPHILFVDDEIQNQHAFRLAFRRIYEIETASSALEGIEILKKKDIHIIITDQRMPEMTGTEFLAHILPEFPEPIRIILTGYSEVEAVVQAINQGEVYRYLYKPWDKEELKLTIANAFQIHQLRRENHMLVQELKESNSILEAKVKERTKALEQSRVEIAARYKQLSLNHEKLQEQHVMIELLLRELNHRVINNLQAVSAIIGREAEHVQDQALHEVFGRIDKRITDMARIHQQLMYQHNKSASIGLYDYFLEIIQTLKYMHFPKNQEPDVFINTQGISLPQENAYFLGYIVYELVNNSFKYAFYLSPEPRIKIELYQNEDKFRLYVEDNGSGLPQEIQDKNQLKFELIHSLGLKIVHMMAKIHQGQLHIDPNHLEGTRFIVDLHFKPKSL